MTPVLIAPREKVKEIPDGVNAKPLKRFRTARSYPFQIPDGHIGLCRCHVHFRSKGKSILSFNLAIFSKKDRLLEKLARAGS
jgi:hypothetical protein